MNNIGYCCINLSINDDKSRKNWVLVNRGMIKKTFESRGLSYVSELAILNIEDLYRILKWNVENRIFVYRMSSDMFPCIGFYELSDLPNFNIISEKLKSIGDYAKLNKIRLSFHPTHFCILASENPVVVKNSIDELNKHAQIMDIMGLDKSHYYPINIHINTTKPSREEAANRFCEQFKNLSDSCKSRLTVENDDGINQYSTKILYDLVYKKIGIPIVHDFHHHKFGFKDLDDEQSLKLAISTWGNIKPITHMSSSKTIENITYRCTAHADFIYEKINTYGLEFDIEIEAKQKDKAVLKYRNEF